MPFLKFDIVEGRTDKQIKAMLDAAHRAVLKSLGVPERDRYQLVNEHKASRMVVEDTGLGITRTKNVVIVSVTSRPRSQEAKQLFYKELCRELQASCDIEPSDVMVSFVINSDVDWSFGNGVAQFMTGEL
ncbi:hypothetical protein P3T40_004529 [Paraburkholderia sp. EB58]|jgi:hypothetical protein|uniref:tautomerase family protein n=1 Tax=Paraburkholderia sp. EB58 TaxID=3035125 RepID=UPI003D2244DF